MQSSGQAGQAPRNYHPENITGKRVVVSGGTTGIGRAIAHLLAERGARVLIFGRDEEALAQAVRDMSAVGEVHGLSADQSRPQDVRRIFEEADAKLGGVDVLINNAALDSDGVEQMELEEIASVLNTNLFGYMANAHEALQRMKSAGRGHIVNIGSMSAEVREEEHGPYVATKAGIRAFSASLRKSVNKEGVKVSLIEPGLVESALTVGPEGMHSTEEARQKQQEETMLPPEDIAEAVHYVLTQPARCDVVMIQIRPHAQAV